MSGTDITVNGPSWVVTENRPLPEQKRAEQLARLLEILHSSAAPEGKRPGSPGRGPKPRAASRHKRGPQNLPPHLARSTALLALARQGALGSVAVDSRLCEGRDGVKDCSGLRDIANDGPE